MVDGVSGARTQRQSAYRILVASTPAKLVADRGDVWDTGKVGGDASVAVRYGGPALQSLCDYWWKVKLWDRDGRETAWSAPARFLTGKLRPDDWKGRWIGASARAANGPAGVLGFAVEAGSEDSVQWVQVDLGGRRRIDRVVLHPMRHNDPAAGGWVDGYGFPIRFRLEASDDPDFKAPHRIVDQTGGDFPNPGWKPVSFGADGLEARYVRLTVTRLWRRAPNLPFVYTLGELQVFSGQQNAALHAPVTASSAVEGYGWSKQQLTDGLALSPDAESPPAERLRYPHGAFYLRKELMVPKPVRRAVVAFSGLGWSELAIDGKRVDDALMAPGLTQYDRRTPYRVLDVSDWFKTPGRKTLQVTLFDGWYALSRDPWVHQFERRPYVDQPKLILDLHLEYMDGASAVISSDETWNWSQGPVTRSWICEADSDLRLKPGDGGWKPVKVVSGPAGRLVADRDRPTRVVEVLKPVSLENRAGEWVYSFDRQFQGFVRFHTHGPAGTKVRLVTTGIRGRAGITPRTFTAILAGLGVEEFAPRETYTAISKVFVSGTADPPALQDLEGCQVSGVAEDSGGFQCSDDLSNWIHESVKRTQANYVTFLPNDPTREFKGWTQDIQSMFWSAQYLFQSQAMYERWERDMLDNQGPDGNLPEVAPGPVLDDGYNSPWWGGCAVWLPREVELYDGDSTLQNEAYPSIKRYLEFLARQPGGIQDWGLGDWLAWEGTPRAIVNTPAAIHFARIAAQTAERIGQASDAARFRALSKEWLANFNQRFFDPSTGIYGVPGSQAAVEGSASGIYPALRHSEWWAGNRPCTQAGQVIPIELNLVPETVKEKANDALRREIEAHGSHLSTGFVATPYLLKWLGENAPELGRTVTTARDFPSWYGMTVGADSDLMMETWNGGQALMPSLGGNIAAWDMEALLGIRPDPQGAGFKRILIRPGMAHDLHWAEGWYDSARGRIVVRWRKRGDTLALDVTIPANTTATVYLPVRSAVDITESGKPLSQVAGVQLLSMQKELAEISVDSGSYRFRSRTRDKA